MTTWNLVRLRQEIRNITGNFDVTQMTDSEIDNYINDFYLYEFPEELRSLRLKNYYEFVTVPNVSVYSLPQNTDIVISTGVSNPITLQGTNKAVYNVSPPVYVDGYQSAWYQDPDTFQRIWPDLNTVQMSVAVTDGINSTFSFSLFATPILQGSLTIGCSRPNTTTTIPTDNFRDSVVPDVFTNPGNIIRNGNTIAGSVNYLTGAVSITFSSIPAAGISINAHFYAYVAARPRDIMFFNQQFTVRPVPQDAYRVKMVAQYQPTVLLDSGSEIVQFSGDSNSAGTPQTPSTETTPFFEWWQLLVYGSSIKIYIRQGDHQEAERYLPYYEKMKLEAQRRTLKQMSNSRISTIYSDGQGATVPFPPYPIY
jgi:hypothetical protein